jgi:hypothetical protein
LRSPYCRRRFHVHKSLTIIVHVDVNLQRFPDAFTTATPLDRVNDCVLLVVGVGFIAAGTMKGESLHAMVGDDAKEVDTQRRMERLESDTNDDNDSGGGVGSDSAVGSGGVGVDGGGDGVGGVDIAGFLNVAVVVWLKQLSFNVGVVVFWQGLENLMLISGIDIDVNGAAPDAAFMNNRSRK